MVKRRQPESSKKQPSIEAIEQFAAGADDQKPSPAPISAERARIEAGKTAKRDFKAIRVPFNEYEYRTLEEAASRAGRT